MTPEQFRANRECLGLTQAELGGLFGYSPCQINRLENGATPIRAIHALAMMAVLSAVSPVPAEQPDQ